jgi:hypothetical protein
MKKAQHNLKMKNILLSLLIAAVVISCNSIDTKKHKTADTSNKKQTTGLKDAGTNSSKSKKAVEQKNDFANQILGIWAFVGSENATFVIKKKEIYYVDEFTSYKYSIINDSLKIKYPDDLGAFKIKMKGLDTLILSGDEDQVYYRFND